LIPYKGISIFLAYVAVPAIQFLLPGFHYRFFLVIFICCSLVAVTLTYYFYAKVHYISFNEHQKQDAEKSDPPAGIHLDNDIIIRKAEG